MKHIKLQWILFIILTGLCTACNKNLDVLPSSSQVDGNIITDSKSAATALNGVYYTFANSGKDDSGVPAVLWANLFQNISSELSNMVNYPYGGSPFTDHTYTPISTAVDGLWNYGYKIVNTANGFMKNIEPVENIDPKVKTEMVAEAKFLRAFGNSTLLLYYGQYDNPNSDFGIIIRNSFVDSKEINQPRAKVGDSYNAILSDLDAAIADLPAQNTSKLYANIWVAKLLKARVLINRGAAGDYNTVVSLTEDIIKNGPYHLEPKVKDIFLSKAFTSNEVMMGVQQYPNQNLAYYNNVSYTTYPYEIATDTLASLLKGDPRSQWMLANVIDPSYGTPENILIKYYPGSITPNAPDPITENCYAFRLTEAYLLQAEALVHLGGTANLTTAKGLLKTVLACAGITDVSAVDQEITQSGLLEQVIREEIKNFVAEAGQDWLAARRLPLETLKKIIPTMTKSSLLILPIPLTETSTNNQVKQNPDY